MLTRKPPTKTVAGNTVGRSTASNIRRGEADVRGETRRYVRLLDEGRHELHPVPRVGVSKRTGKAWRNGRTRAPRGRNEPTVDWYRSCGQTRPSIRATWAGEGASNRGPSASGRFDPRHRPPAERDPTHSRPRVERNRNPSPRRLRALPRPAEGRGPAQTPQTAQGGRGHATVGRDRRRVARPGADSQPAEAGLRIMGICTSVETIYGAIYLQAGANSSRS